jgi:TPR repeat protein
MQVPSADDGVATSKCINCGAAISAKANFCEVCGVHQAASATSLHEPVEEPLLEPAVSGIEAQPIAPTQFPPTAANQTLNPAESGTAQNKPLTSKRILRIVGIAAAVIMLVCIGASYLSAFEQKRARDNYNLGVAYENGQGVPKDTTQAVSWFRKAADQGNADAQERLGLMYVYGADGLAKDDAQAVTWFRRAARQENAEAQAFLGFMYVRGQGGLTEDDAQAVFWYRKAADHGNPYAQSNLAAMYANGQGGLVKDDAQAVSLWRKAADQGNADAEYWLGVMYEYGRGSLANDNGQALSWFKKAADQGYALAKDAPARMQQEQQKQARVAALEQQEHERMATQMGTPIDFATLYAKLYGTGLEIGKRYQVKAIAYSDLNMLGSKSGQSIGVEHDFDESTQLEATIRQAVSTPNNADLVCSFVVSMGNYHRLLIHRAEDCQTIPKY